MPRTVAERALPNPQAIRFQKLKTDIHRQLIEGLDMSTLNRIKPERLRREVRQLAIQLTGDSPEMLIEACVSSAIGARSV